nr:trimeric intracellular cation channel family protein [Psychromonas sp. CNPT3]
MQDYLYIFDMLGTMSCAVSGVIVATRLRMDPFGLLVIATVTAVGGGTSRDIMMGATPVFWIHDNNYIYVVFISVLVSVLWLRRLHKVPPYLLLMWDAFGLAIFTVVGAQKAMLLGFSPLIVVAMGCVTGVAGGMIRDVLTGQIPFVLQKEIYATASLFGALLYVGCSYMGLEPIVVMIIAILGALSLRLAALYWHLSLPILSAN